MGSDGAIKDSGLQLFFQLSSVEGAYFFITATYIRVVRSFIRAALAFSYLILTSDIPWELPTNLHLVSTPRKENKEQARKVLT